jgi:hypothetical protein
MRKVLFFSHLSVRQPVHAILLTSLAAMLVGCGYGNPFSVSGGQPSAALSGTAFGGQQPVGSASVQVWAAGVSGYGSQATLLATTSSNSTGGFQFASGAYNCPTAPSTTPLYITATGGNPGNSSGNANPDILLVAMLGSCSSAENAMVNLNEVTTVAAAYAMSGFINPAKFGLSATTAAGDSIGTTYSATPTYAANNNNIVGLNNAVANAGVLANITTGTSPGTTTNGTVDVAKINTLANILAYCVNSDPTGGGTQCSTLFSDVSPSTGTAATNTFEAAYYLCQNPTNSASSTTTVLNLASTQPPFQPMLTTAPTDWTVGVNYTATGMTAGQRLAIDPIGNVWVTSANSTSGGQVTEFSPTGAVLNTFSGSFPATTGTTLTTPTGIAIDRYTATSQGYSNVAVADSGTNSVFVFSEGAGNAAPAYLQTIAGSTAASGAEEPYAITFAGTVDPNFMYFTETNTNAVTGTQSAYFEKSTYNTTNKVYGAIASDHGAIAGPYAITVSTATNTVFVVGEYQALTSSTSDSGAIRNFRNIDLTGYTNQYANTLKADFPIGAVFDSNNNFWFSNAAYAYSGGTAYGPLTPQGPTNSFLSVAAVTTGSGTTGANQVADSLSTSPFATAGGAGGLNDASYLAIDGNNSLWVANLGGVTTGTSPNTTTTYGVSQFANNGSSAAATALSPATTGYVHTMSAPNDIAIDSAGNVWVVNSGAVNYVTEIVGAATPTITPIVYNIYYGTWGKRP